jgi:hypothetical protein
MALSSTNNKIIHTGTNLISVYNYGFKIFTNTDLEIKVRLISTGVETPLVLTTDYTVSGVGALAGGSITLVSAGQAWLTGGFLSSNYKIVIKRKRPLTQTTAVKNQGDYYPELHENQFDKLVMQDQDLQEQLDRSIKLAVSVESGDLDLEIPASYVGSDKAILMLNSAGDALIDPPKTYDELAAGASVGATFTSSRAIVSDSNGIPSVSSTTATEIGYVNGVTSAIQTQIDSKQTTITGAASTIVSSNLTASRVVISNVSGKITTTNVTHTEVDYVSGVTGQLSGNSQSATLQNKTLDNSNIVTVRDDRFTMQDNSDATKQAVFELSGITTATTRTLTVPNVDTEIMGLAGTQTVTGNKTFTGTVVLPKVLHFASATGNPASATSGNPIIFPTELADPSSAYNNTTGRFTVPTGGADYYEIIMSYVATGGANASWYWYKNASIQNLIGIYTAADLGNCISVITSLLADGDIIDIRANNTIDISDGCITFKRIGGYR